MVAKNVAIIWPDFKNIYIYIHIHCFDKYTPLNISIDTQRASNNHVWNGDTLNRRKGTYDKFWGGGRKDSTLYGSGRVHTKISYLHQFPAQHLFCPPHRQGSTNFAKKRFCRSDWLSSLAKFRRSSSAAKLFCAALNCFSWWQTRKVEQQKNGSLLPVRCTDSEL